MIDNDTNQEWKKEPSIAGKHGCCLNCGPRPSTFPAEGIIAVGFGYAALERDGEPIYTEPNDPDEDAYFMTGAQAEWIAAADTDHDWRIVLHGPLSGRTYQRHGPGAWVLIAQDNGFA